MKFKKLKFKVYTLNFNFFNFILSFYKVGKANLVKKFIKNIEKIFNSLYILNLLLSFL